MDVQDQAVEPWRAATQKPRYVGFGELLRLCAQADDDQRRLALRRGLLAMGCNEAGMTVFLAADRKAKRWASKAGLTVAGWSAPILLSRALQLTFAAHCLFWSRRALMDLRPRLSASRRLSLGQKCLSGLIGAGILATWSTHHATLIAELLACFAAALFTAVTGWRAQALLFPASGPRRFARLARLPDVALPVYTVLVPVLRELPVIAQLVTNLRQLDYPPDRLDIKIICEETDLQMRAYLNRLDLPRMMEVVVVPRGYPQTKPRALNYALRFARGELVTVYDAEDNPEPQQLRRAAAVFAAAAHRPGARPLGCVQAALVIHNHGENWLTRQFALEYLVLFKRLLPKLAELRLPVPLGGTSNHFPLQVLTAAGGWDAHNVTEDADLGIRLMRQGFAVHMLSSYTAEEAPAILSVWLRQRSRWLKGWMQSWLVHMRAPGELAAAAGWRGFIGVHCVFAGIVVSALIHPVCVATALLAFAHLSDGGPLVRAVAGFSTGLMLASYGIAMALAVAVCTKRRPAWLWQTVLSLPAYWLLISAAAWMGLAELIIAPFRWNKTPHGRRTRHKQETEMDGAGDGN